MKFLFENANLVFSPNLNQHRPTFITDVRLRKNPQQNVDNRIAFQAIKC
jgi:hypothetical protein